MNVPIPDSLRVLACVSCWNATAFLPVFGTSDRAEGATAADRPGQATDEDVRRAIESVE